MVDNSKQQEPHHIGAGADAIREIERLVNAEAPVIMEEREFGGVKGIFGSIYKGPDKGWENFEVKYFVDKWRTAPERRTGTAKALTLASFVDLVNRHKDESSAVFADFISPQPSLTAVIDYHRHAPAVEEKEPPVNSPRFCQHRVSYAFPLSDEWKAWFAASGRWMQQGEFAAWLEDRLPELANPDAEETELFSTTMLTTVAAPNQIMGLSRGLAINVESAVGQTLTLQSGESSVTFSEKHTDAQGQPVKIPGGFILSIPLFEGGEPRRVPVRLRYKKEGQKIVWSFALWRAKDVVRAALDVDLATVAAETGLPVYQGSPEA
jgi:uncharacterized protein YfdQ (DUF2303 family)